MRGLFLRPGTENPPSYASGTLPPYYGPGEDRKDYLENSRRHNRRSLRTSDLGGAGTTAQFTSAGAYELTTFGNTTFGSEVALSAGFVGSPSSAPSNAPRQHFGLATGYHSLPTDSFPYGSIRRKLEEGP